MKSKIALLIIIFLFCGIFGYFLGTLFEKKEPVVVMSTPVAPEKIQSTIPVVDSISVPVGKQGKYDFNVYAYVESRDTLTYSLYSDEALSTKVDENHNGVFTDIPGNDTKTYYLRVQNARTFEASPISIINGFEKFHMYTKIQENQLEQLFNVTKSWTKAPKWMSSSVSPNLQIKIVNADPSRELRTTRTLGEICMKVANNQWLSVDVIKLSYDIQDRLTRLEIAVTYP